MAKKNIKKTKSKKQKYSSPEPEETEKSYSEDFESEESEKTYSEQSDDRNSTSLTSDEEEEEGNEQEKMKKRTLIEKTKKVLKKKINDWLDLDDKIKEMSNEMKNYRKEKKENEDEIVKMISVLGLEEGKKIEVTDNSNVVKGRVYTHKTVTKGQLKETIIKDALMEIMKNEAKVDQIIKKIDSKRPINEKYHLKRAKG